MIASAALLTPPRAAAGNHFSYPIAVFSYESHPSLPLEAYAAGDLGIVLPTYARSYLYAAYRWMEGVPMTTEEQAALEEYWNWKLGLLRPPEPAGFDAWYALRGSLEPPLPEFPDRIERYISTDDYVQFQGCVDSGFALAAARLRGHVERFGAASREVREWLIGQDIVFEHCTTGVSGPALPPAAPADLHPEIRRDRRYQVAASRFAAGEFEEAEGAFRAIVADPSWPGGLWAPYMVGRSILWQARVRRRDPRYGELLRRARVEFQNVLQDDRLAATHDAARALLIRTLMLLQRFFPGSI